jgi:mRNA interferase RelE/StbE
LNQGWRYEITRRAERDLERADRETRERIFDTLDRFVEDPTQVRQRKLAGRTDEWRLRVGSWRIRYRRDTVNKVIVVLRVLPRREAYRD